MSEQGGLHTHHRERLRDRLLKCGPMALEEHELLEFLLFRPIRRRNTNDIAHRLINRFGSLHKVLEANIDELTSVEGVGEKTAQFLRDLGRAVECCASSTQLALLHIRSVGDAYACADEYFAKHPFAGCVFLALDGFNGLVAEVELPPNPSARELLHTALQYGAQRAVLAFKDVRNFPPESAEALKQTLSTMGARLLDCVTVGTNYTSLFGAQNGDAGSYLRDSVADGAVLLHSELPAVGMGYLDATSAPPSAAKQPDVLPVGSLAAQFGSPPAPSHIRETERLIREAKARNGQASKPAARTFKGKPLDREVEEFIGEFIDPSKLPPELFEILVDEAKKKTE